MGHLIYLSNWEEFEVEILKLFKLYEEFHPRFYEDRDEIMEKLFESHGIAEQNNEDFKEF